MVYPTNVWNSTLMMWKQNCPSGFIHVPHLFFELYWNTIDFADRWTSFQGDQPFTLSNGDLSGCSAHGDFMAAWNTTILQHIIDTCDAGDIGMDQCAGITVRDASTECHAPSPIDEVITGNLTALPGNNPPVGWGMGGGGSEASISTAAAETTNIVVDATTADTPAPVTSSSSAPTQFVASSPNKGAHDEADDAAPAAVTTTSLLSVTTLPSGEMVTKTVVDWITVTTWVTEDVAVATKTPHKHSGGAPAAAAQKHQHRFHHRRSLK